MKIDLAGIHSFIFVRTLKPEWFKCSAKDHGPTVTVLAVLAVGGYGGGERWGIHSLVGGFGGFGGCKKTSKSFEASAKSESGGFGDTLSIPFDL